MDIPDGDGEKRNGEINVGCHQGTAMRMFSGSQVIKGMTMLIHNLFNESQWVKSQMLKLRGTEG